MPEISRFFGIVITMNFDDHNPPHFHARYGSLDALFTIEPVALHRGDFPARATGLVIEWAMQHRDELWTDWKLAKQSTALNRIKPLE